ncbi:MAG: hypothetical protein PGN33_01645 [Methylobacterium radiotolerans]
MISGAVRGNGRGDALATHLLKTGNEAVAVVPARGLGSAELVGQIRELTAMSMGGRTDRPLYHVHANPDPGIPDEAAARARWWDLFEKEFGLEGQPYCGVEHVKESRRHEHRVYGLVRPDGSVVDLSWDYLRREKCSRVTEFEFGMAPVASKHARAITRRLRIEGRADVADWLERSGTTKAPRPVAPLTPAERLQQERTAVPLDEVRKAALDAWRASTTGDEFVLALRARGLDLRRGREGPVIVDAAGAAHLATRVIGAAARRFEGERIRAAMVHARLSGLILEGIRDGQRATRAAARSAGAPAAPDRGGPGPGNRTGDGIRGRRPDRGLGGPDGGGVRRDGRSGGAALERLRALPAGQRLSLVRRLRNFEPSLAAYHAAVERARDAITRMEAEAAYERDRTWALWGKVDIWGLPIK